MKFMEMLRKYYLLSFQRVDVAFLKDIGNQKYVRNKTEFLSDEVPMLETLDYTIRIGSTPTILYFDLYLYSAYAAHYKIGSVYISIWLGHNIAIWGYKNACNAY